MFSFSLTQISNRSIGKIRFDAVTSEDHQSELSITENPIESGASIADHAVVQPKQITINGIMVDHDHGSSSLETLGVPYIRGVSDFLNKFPLPCKVITQTTQTIAKANRILSQASYAVSKIQSAVNSVRQIAPFLPDFGLGGLLDSSSGDSRVQKCYADLVACQKSGETIEIQTGIHLYKNMLIQSIGVNQSQDGSATFTITAREIFIVDTATTQSQSNQSRSNKNGKASTPAGKNKSGRAAVQSATKSQQGTTNPTAVTKESSHLGNTIGTRASNQRNRIDEYKKQW